MRKKLFVLSMDAMVREDIAYLGTKPNFRKIMEKRAEVDQVLTVYPACTYPAHTTLMTGCYPNKHGVYSNFPLRAFPDGIKHWPTEHTWIYAEDIFAAAKRAGCTTASVYWPITANNPNVDYIINEYFFYYPKEGDTILETFAAQGANDVALQAVRENICNFPREVNGKKAVGKRFEDFLMGCTCSLIRNVQPDVMLVHNCILDSYRHLKGVFSDIITEGLDRTDAWLGDVIAAMEDAGVYEDTNFVILSDHGQMDCDKEVKINALLAREGLVELSPNGTVYNWHAYAQTNGLSTTVHLIDNTNRKLYDRVYACLQKLQAEDKYGIERIWTKVELAERYGQNGPYSFMLEAKASYIFSDALTGDIVTNISSKGAHGHMPEKGPQPIFMAHGPAFQDGKRLAGASLVDIAPTLAAVLGQTLPDADGKVLTALLK